MTQQLREELRAAGFPIPKKNGCANCWGDLHQGCDADCGAELPIGLSELIDACGENFSALEKRNRSEASIEERRWYTWQHELVDGKWVKYDGEGSTPEEAVARLWLALNPLDKEDPV